MEVATGFGSSGPPPLLRRALAPPHQGDGPPVMRLLRASQSAKTPQSARTSSGCRPTHGRSAPPEAPSPTCRSGHPPEGRSTTEKPRAYWRSLQRLGFRRIFLAKHLPPPSPFSQDTEGTSMAEKNLLNLITFDHAGRYEAAATRAEGTSSALRAPKLETQGQSGWLCDG